MPSPNGTNGRDASGRFAPGNAGGPGNPHGGKAARFRSILLDAVSDEDMRAVARTLVERAKAGEQWAVRELLDRAIGKPLPAVPTAEFAEQRAFQIVVPTTSRIDG